LSGESTLIDLMPPILEKVTVFVTRLAPHGHELLLFEHPNAGIQIPAGTVEPNESPEAAAIREAYEETNLKLARPALIGYRDDRLPDPARVIYESTRVYARPDLGSFDRAQFRRGSPVTLTGRHAHGFSQVTWEEFDRVPDPQYVTMSITGWVLDRALASTTRRYFYHFEFNGTTDTRWMVHTDNHDYVLFWAPAGDLPPIIPPQDQWLKFFFQLPPGA
jgi:8-oxo-dGTP pyrophosphatase MutT (NUDIX family)